MSDDDLSPALIAARIDPALLARQRWFRHKGVVLGAIDLADAWPVRRDEVLYGWWLLARIPVAEGFATYQLPVRLVPLAEGKPSEERNMLGRIEHAGRAFAIVDAAADPVMAADLVSRTWRREDEPLRSGSLHIELFSPPVGRPTAVHPVAQDSSNTLCRLDSRFVLKLYRCLDAAGAREASLLAALAQYREAAVPEVNALLEYRRDDGERSALALVQEWVDGGQDAWTWFVGRLAAGPTVDLGEELDRMASAVASVHRGLLPMGSRTWTREDTDRLEGRIRRQIEGLQAATDQPDLLRDLDAAREQVDRLAISDGGIVMQVHGDLHLGQMLRRERASELPARSLAAYLVMDFEGEPLASPADRMAPHSPLKDIAGMLRSFDYAAAMARRTGAQGDPSAWDAWLRRAEDRFLSRYFERMPHVGHDRDRLLSLYLLEKATYEIGYELRARPDWVDIPRHGLHRVASRITHGHR